MKNIALPFLTIPEDSVNSSPWTISYAGRALDNPEYLEGWDYAVDLNLIREISIDIQRVSEALKIPLSDLNLAIVVLWGTGGASKPSSRLILHNSAVNITESKYSCIVEENISGSTLSQQLFLETYILVKNSFETGSRIVPARKSLKVWKDSIRIRLEGDVSRFPIQTSSLSSIFGESHAASRALWFLEYETGELDLPLQAAVRIHLNDDHPEFVKRITNGDNFLMQSMMADVICQLVEYVLSSEVHRDAVEKNEDESSLAYQIYHWIIDIFGTYKDAQVEYRSSPSRFRALINSYTEIGDC